MSVEPLKAATEDPRSPQAAELICQLSVEPWRRYSSSMMELATLGPKLCWVALAVFLIGRLDGKLVAGGALRPVWRLASPSSSALRTPESRSHGCFRAVLTGTVQLLNRRARRRQLCREKYFHKLFLLNNLR